MRRNQKRIAELNATIRKLEDRNTLLGDERNELVSWSQFSSVKCSRNIHCVMEVAHDRGKSMPIKGTVQQMFTKWYTTKRASQINRWKVTRVSAPSLLGKTLAFTILLKITMV